MHIPLDPEPWSCWCCASRATSQLRRSFLLLNLKYPRNRSFSSLQTRYNHAIVNNSHDSVVQFISFNPYSAKGLGDRLYATLHKMPGEVDYSFCLFLKSKNSPLYTSGSHFIHSTARSKPSLLKHFPIYYRLL